MSFKFQLCVSSFKCFSFQMHHRQVNFHDYYNLSWYTFSYSWSVIWFILKNCNGNDPLPPRLDNCLKEKLCKNSFGIIDQPLPPSELVFSGNILIFERTGVPKLRAKMFWIITLPQIYIFSWPRCRACRVALFDVAIWNILTHLKNIDIDKGQSWNVNSD